MGEGFGQIGIGQQPGRAGEGGAEPQAAGEQDQAEAQDAVGAARLGPLLDAVLSVEDAGVFKPDPRVYALPAAAFGLPAGRMAFVSSNAWDAQAAGVAGYRVFWCNRAGQPDEYGLTASATVMQDLSALPDLLG